MGTRINPCRTIYSCIYKWLYCDYNNDKAKDDHGLDYGDYVHEMMELMVASSLDTTWQLERMEIFMFLLFHMMMSIH
jgi:hypothetical protein